MTLFSTGDCPTGNALIYVAGEEAENMIAVDPGANLTVSEDEVRQCRPAIAAADILLTQLENNLPAIEQVIAIAREAQTFIILNPAPFQPVPDSLLAQVDMLTPNATECTLLTGVPVRDGLRRASGAGAACQRHSLTDRDLGHAGALFSDGKQRADPGVSSSAERHHRRGRCV